MVSPRRYKIVKFIEREKGATGSSKRSKLRKTKKRFVLNKEDATRGAKRNKAGYMNDW